MRKIDHFLFVGLFVCAPIISSCLDVATGRAERDLTIGRANLSDLRVEVDHGLAAVRSLDRNGLRLWATAPSVSFRIEPGWADGLTYRIRIENVLPDAQLSFSTDGGAPIPAQVIESPHPTDRTWQIEMTDKPVTLKLGPPDETLLEPWRFAVYADVQEALGNVEDIYEKMNATPAIRFALISGDLTRQGEPTELDEFQTKMKMLGFPCFSTLGNHELGTRDDLYHSFFGRGNYSFQFRGVRFTMLDSASATLDPLVYSWLDGWLEEGRNDLHIVTMHIAPVDPVGARNGSFASRAEADKLLMKLARGGVDMTLYGHVHSYYAFENAGIQAHISGGGGALPERMDGIGRHFLTVDVTPGKQIDQVAIVRVD